MKFFKAFSKENDKKVRDMNWKVEETIIQELSQPGLTSDERNNLADQLRKCRIGSRQWEEINCENWKKYGESIGTIKACVGMVGAFAVGIVIGIVKNIIRV